MKYNRTSLAYQIEETDDVTQLVKEVKTEVRNKKSNSRMFTCICCLYAILLIASLLIKTADINEKKAALNKIEDEYNQLVNENKKLEVAINSAVDLRKVEEIAISSLNMNRPKKSQMVYVNTKPRDYGEVIKTDEKESNEYNVFASVVKSITGLFAYSR